MLATGTCGRASAHAADGAWVAVGSQATDDARGTVSMQATVGVHESAAEGCCHLWNSVLMVVMTSQSTS
jgi:hypothetical protein